ncbi:MAG TPA: P-II family nitrogen regulator [Bacteroidota bacterium]|nr:P-II family nitrogen regulator [Bacteroidota bacterium]
MKRIRAIIRIAKINDTKEALAAIGLPSFTVSGKVEGRGRGTGYGPRFQEAVANPESRAILIELGDMPRLKTKRMINLIVTDDKVDAAVQAIIGANQTGNSGDGKIFVIPLADAIQVRTGDAGDTVLD